MEHYGEEPEEDHVIRVQGCARPPSPIPPAVHSLVSLLRGPGHNLIHTWRQTLDSGPDWLQMLGA